MPQGVAVREAMGEPIRARAHGASMQGKRRRESQEEEEEEEGDQRACPSSSSPGLHMREAEVVGKPIQA
uniref:Uncharacterized protein n=1 Tax=Oryza glumipatula TaxID=40148 RepID=A0A0E0APA4_9ORYZ